MIVIKCELKFIIDDNKMVRKLESIIYDTDLNGFYKCNQILSPDLVSELDNPYSLVSIKDIVQPLDGFRLSENEVKDLIFDFFNNDYINYTTIGQSKLIQEAREFLVKYKRDIIIEEVIKK